jgi:hypothetical protein
MPIFRGSSMVEQEAVNFKVAGSSPAPGAIALMLTFRYAQAINNMVSIYAKIK